MERIRLFTTTTWITERLARRTRFGNLRTGGAPRQNAYGFAWIVLIVAASWCIGDHRRSVLVTLLLTALTLLWPMRARLSELRVLPKRDVAAALGYFALIGLGSMFVEIGLLSRLSVFLGHPTLPLAVLLGGLISFTGVGSLLSARVPLVKPRWARLYPLLPAILVALASLLALPAMRPYQSAAVPVQIAVSLGILLLPALAMGLCFPLGLRLCDQMESARTKATPRLGQWLWGINGAFGVCASGLALASSMVWGVPVTLAIGAACYLLLPLATFRLAR